jgi:glycerol-3-phosphate dehydrogenase
MLWEAGAVGGSSMQRDIARLARPVFDLAIIGGGIIGAAIARDASRRGMRVALIERGDFGSAASEAMSRTIHGGLRYLAQGRFGLVREALQERAIWMRTAPGFVCEQMFILPLTGGVSAFKANAAIALYERLAGQRPARLTRSQALEREPVLDIPGLTGAAVYHDARIDDPHRLIIALLRDAAEHGCVMANHVECAGLRIKDERVTGLAACDLISSAPLDIHASNIVNATGPWAQRLADLLLPGQRQARLTASKGVHILTRPMTNGHAIALSGKGEHGFVLPWMGMSLIGTTDEPCNADGAESRATPEQLRQLTQKIGRLLPASKPFLDAPLGSYAGVRALPGSHRDSYRAGREVALRDHAADGADGFISVFGGKWTTARRIAEMVADRLALRFDGRLRPCDTRVAQVAPPAQSGTVEDRVRRAHDHEMAVTAKDVMRRLGRQFSHGSAADRQRAEKLLAAMRLPERQAQAEEGGG